MSDLMGEQAAAVLSQAGYEYARAQADLVAAKARVDYWSTLLRTDIGSYTSMSVSRDSLQPATFSIVDGQPDGH